jgi:hypothetical protein
MPPKPSSGLFLSERLFAQRLREALPHGMEEV